MRPRTVELPIRFALLSWALLAMAPHAVHAQIGGTVGVPGADQAPGTGPITNLTINEIAEGVGPNGERTRSRVAIMERMHARPSGPEATLWIQLLDVVDEVDPSVAPVAVRAVGMAVETDQAVRASQLVMDATADVEGDDRAALLSLAAHLADRADRRRSAEIRATLLSDHPSARQVPEAQLLRARWMLQSRDLAEEGLAMLEDLIVSHPEHPVTPEARRLFRENEAR